MKPLTLPPASSQALFYPKNRVERRFMNTHSLRFIGLPTVCELTGLSKTSVYTLVDFPRPVKIVGEGAKVQGGSRWVEFEVIEWMQSRIQLRDTRLAPVYPGLARGRPSNAEKEDASCRKITIRELRIQQSSELHADGSEV